VQGRVTGRGRVVRILAGAALFGVVAGLVHGNAGGLRSSVGNLSAPWLAVPLVAAWWSGSVVRGAVIGWAATMTALAGFYVGLTATMVGHLGAAHGPLASYGVVLLANRIWFVAGLASGPLCGAFAGRAGGRLRADWLLLTIGSLMVGEILVVSGLGSRRIPVLGLRWSDSDLRGYAVEAALGVLLVAATVLRRGRPAARR
jgi:hypothetical protein